MSESLVEQFKHNIWANEQVFEACEGLSDAQLDATIPGAFGSIRNTLTHITGAQERFATALVGVAARAQPGATVTTTWRGEAYTLPAWLLLAQAITHATEHRTQVSAILTHQGIEPPSMDVWTYHEGEFNGDWSQLWSW